MITFWASHTQTHAEVYTHSFTFKLNGKWFRIPCQATFNVYIPIKTEVIIRWIKQGLPQFSERGEIKKNGVICLSDMHDTRLTHNHKFLEVLSIIRDGNHLYVILYFHLRTVG